MSFPIHQDCIHLLSKKSKRLQRDTFFFRYPRFVQLLGGINRKRTPISPATLYRWGRLCDPECPEFELLPVKLKQFGILHYVPESIGSAISTDSSAILPAGDYCLNLKENDEIEHDNRAYPFLAFDPNTESFAERKAQFSVPLKPEFAHEQDYVDEILSWYNFPPGLEDTVTARDRGQCVVTGEKLDIGVTWICPPPWAPSVKTGEDPTTPQELSNPSNAMLLRRDLIDAFHQNAFGIDVDDNCRVVVFTDIGPLANILRPFQTEPAFFHRITASGGNVTFDYSYDVIWDTMEALGIESDDPHAKVASMDHPLWQTPLGKEIFADYMKNATFMSGVELEDVKPAED